MPDAILRFAPSPNGRLHLGHAYSALLNDRMAQTLGGVWLLRIEDIDLSRATAQNIADVEEDLAWLGLAWPRPVRRQSEHMADYAAASEQLEAAALVYPCFCSRGVIAAAVAAQEHRTGEAWPRDPDGSPLYPGSCRHLDRRDAMRRIDRGAPHAWRLDTGRAVAAHPGVCWERFDRDGTIAIVQATPERWGDVVVVRKEVATSYHLSVVVDDAIQRITHVVRGQDVEAATDIHALLGACLGRPSPRYHHHPLVTDEAGQKLSKSRNSLSLAALREAGESPASIRRRLGVG